MQRKKILVSNDDGVNHPALWALVNSISDLGQVMVSAPDRNCSGVGTSMTLHNPVRAIKVKPVIDGVETFAVQGMPSDSVILGLHQLAEGAVDAVVTGINPGNNITTNVLVSGTLGAAYAACLAGIPAMAVSVGYKVDTGNPLLQKAINAATAALLDHHGPALVNLNFPWADDWPLQGAKITVPAPRISEGLVRRDAVGEDNYYWIYWGPVSGDKPGEVPENSDVAALTAGYVSVSSMSWMTGEDAGLALVRDIAAAIEAVIK